MFEAIGNSIIWLCNIPKRMAEKRTERERLRTKLQLKAKKIAMDRRNAFEKQQYEEARKTRELKQSLDAKLLAAAQKRRRDDIKEAFKKRTKRELRQMLAGIDSFPGVTDRTGIRIGDDIITVGELRRRVNE